MEILYDKLECLGSGSGVGAGSTAFVGVETSFFSTSCFRKGPNGYWTFKGE